MHSEATIYILTNSTLTCVVSKLSQVCLSQVAHVKISDLRIKKWSYVGNGILVRQTYSWDKSGSCTVEVNLVVKP